MTKDGVVVSATPKEKWKWRIYNHWVKHYFKKNGSIGKKNNWEISELLFCLVTFPPSLSPWQCRLLEIGLMALSKILRSLLSVWAVSWLFGTAWRRPTETCHRAQQGGDRDLLGSLLPLNVGLCASPPWSPGTLDSPLKRIQRLSSSQRGNLGALLLEIAPNLHLRQVFLGSVVKTQRLSYISASLSGVTATPDMSLKWGIIVVSSTHQSERVEKSFLLGNWERGEPFLAKESQNGFLKIICWSRREKKCLLRRGGSALGLIWEEAHLLFGNLVWALFCQLRNSSLEELKSHIWGWEIKRLGIIWVRSMAVINMRLCEE